MPSTILNALYAFTFLILTTTLGKGYFYCLPFTDKKTVANKIKLFA